MCALIAMSVYCTEENKRDEYFFETMRSLSQTVDFNKHQLGISINGYTKETITTINDFREFLTYKIYNDINIGTAEAINKIWKFREKGQHAIKMDDDIFIHNKGWVEEMEEVISIDKTIGQVALKRKDLWENTSNENPFYRTTLRQLPHENGKRWITVEETNHCIGSCVLHSSDLLDKVGYLQQPKTYGLDDSLMSLRSHAAGFKNVFLPHIVIDHLDISPPVEWQKNKNIIAAESWPEYDRIKQEIAKGNYYYNPYE